jgi:hypothetical protein
VGLLIWDWKFYIAPAPIIEKQNPYTDREISYRHWGMYVTRKIFRGLKHPIAGDLADIPNYGPCKVERVIYWTSRPSRSFVLGVVISPDSLGSQQWWSENKNDPVSKFPENWTFDFDLPKPYFKDIEVLPNGPVS